MMPKSKKKLKEGPQGTLKGHGNIEHKISFTYPNILINTARKLKGQGYIEHKISFTYPNVLINTRTSNKFVHPYFW